MILVERSAPLLTVQDAGRPGYLADGVTRSGPLDARSLAVGNALVGNDARAAAFEGCLGGAQFRCERALTFALTGADVVATRNRTRIDGNRAAEANRGDVITVERIVLGAIWYLSVRGGIDVPLVLGSRATHLAAGLGGADGMPIRPGARLPVASAAQRAVFHTHAPPEIRTRLDDAAIPLAPAPRSDALSNAEWATFYASTFTVSRATSRVGYRLEGPTVPAHLPADLPSEPACAGAMQLPPEGQPIVLMADHPTIGGYPFIGVVPAHALGAFAQRAPGTSVRFSPMSVEEAIAANASADEALSALLGVA
jgi:biotin-dependent carboxylase-like uncharacterized protein